MPQPAPGEAPLLFFDLHSQRATQRLVKPAFVYLFAFLAARNPRLLLPLHNRIDELWALLYGGLESWYLHTRDATYFENFFGIKRAERDGAPLTARGRALGLVSLILLPYLKERVDRFHESLGGDLDIELPNDGNSDERSSIDKTIRTLQRAFRKSYPVISAVYQLADVLCQIRYITGAGSYFSLVDALLGITYKRVTMRDMLVFEQRRAVVAGGPRGNTARWLAAALFESVKYVIPLVVVAARLSESEVTETPVIPPAPEGAPRTREAGAAVPEDGQCPVCRKERVNPAFSDTGFVFCYACIAPRINKLCPVTGRRVREVHRIY